MKTDQYARKTVARITVFPEIDLGTSTELWVHGIAGLTQIPVRVYLTDGRGYDIYIMLSDALYDSLYADYHLGISPTIIREILRSTSKILWSGAITTSTQVIRASYWESRH